MLFVAAGPGSGPSICPDDDIFQHLSLVYARSHHTMAATNGTLCDGDFFADGITNGAEWYPISGRFGARGTGWNVVYNVNLVTKHGKTLFQKSYRLEHMGE